jgi:hypothetical protein
MLGEILQTSNSLNTEETLRIPLPHSDSSPTLHSGDSFEFSIKLHAESVGEQELCLLFIYREVCVFAQYHMSFTLLSLPGWFRVIPSHSALSTLHSAYSHRSYSNCTALPLFKSLVFSQSRIVEYLPIDSSRFDAGHLSKPHLEMQFYHDKRPVSLLVFPPLSQVLIASQWLFAAFTVFPSDI